MTHQRVYGGARLLGSGPSLRNIQIIDHNAMPMIAAMAKAGLVVDLSHFARMEKQLVDDMDSITEDVHTLTGHYVNCDSGDQLSKLLFKDLGLKQARLKLTSSGDRESVENEVLTAIQHDHPVVPKLLDYKELSKLLGTYVRPMPKLARKDSQGVWRMYPNFTTTRVPSGRLACKEPNLLAIPSRTERGREVRKGFIAPPGWVYVSCDMSQIEVRMAAHYSEDGGLCHVYDTGQDIYSDFAITAFRLEDNRYQSESGTWMYPSVHRMDHRYPAKTCILASIYDVSAAGLLEQMPVICAGCGLEAREHTCNKFRSYWTEDKCQELINAFYRKYPGVMQDRRKHHAIARRYGYVYDTWGRLLHCAAVRSVLPWVVSAALREVGNFPYQSGAGGCIKLVMAQSWDQLNDSGMVELVSPALQIHDELLFTCREDVADELTSVVNWDFENCVRLKVPIEASGAKAENWGSLKK